MPTYPDTYFDRHNPSEDYERHLFLAGNVLQSAELNELQSSSEDKLRRVTDSLFLDGNVLKGGDIVLDGVNCLCEAGSIYLNGLVRRTAERAFVLPQVDSIQVGLFLVETVVSPSDDVGLRDPAITAYNQQEDGASRLRVTVSWGYEDEPGKSGHFYSVYRIEDGVVLNHAAPPQVNATDLAITRYDRQSTGGFYVASGMEVKRLADEGDTQVYSLGAGEARVNGVELVYRQARRFAFTPTSSTDEIIAELFRVTEATGSNQVVTLARSPLAAVSRVSCVRRVTETVIKGVASGIDTLAHTSIIAIESVTQGATTFIAGTHYTHPANTSNIDWSTGGSTDDPDPGSQYTVVYRFNASFTPTSLTDNGFTVTGTTKDAQNRDLLLVNDTDITVDYTYKIPRYDILCLNESGQFVMIVGVPSTQRARVPSIPAGLLRLALIYQTWDSNATLTNVAVRMVPMSELNAINTRIDTLFALMAEERLVLNMTVRDNTAKKGVFSDPFFDDDLRDQGLDQDAAIFRTELTTGVTTYPFTQSLPTDVTLNMSLEAARVAVNQPLRTGSMLVNPYDSYAAMPGVATLYPAVDFWTEFQTNWLSPVTRQFDEDVYADDRRDYFLKAFDNQDAAAFNGNRPWERLTRTQFIALHTTVEESEFHEVDVEKVGVNYTKLKYLRSIPVRFELSGFGVDEELLSVKFDGRELAFEAVV